MNAFDPRFWLAYWRLLAVLAVLPFAGAGCSPSELAGAAPYVQAGNIAGATIAGIINPAIAIPAGTVAGALNGAITSATGH